LRGVLAERIARKVPRINALALLVLLSSGCFPQIPPGTYMPTPDPPPPAQATAPPLVVAIPPAVDEPPAPPPVADPQPPLLLAGGGWPLLHGDLGRTGHSNAAPIVTPRVLWKTTVGIQGWLNGPVIAGSLVLVPSSGDKHNTPDARDGIFALELRTGKPRWHAHFDGDANGVALAADRAFATGDDGYTYGLSLATGAVIWRQKGQGKVYSGPLPIGDRVIVGDAGGLLRAYAQADGTPLWKVQLDGSIRGGASSDGTSIYAVSTGGEAVALSLDGKERWRRTVTRPGYGGGRPVPIEAYSAPIVADGLVILPFARDTGYDTPALFALDAATGKTRWEAKGKGKDDWGNIRSTPALVSGTLVYSEPYSGDVVGVDAKSGRARFRVTVGPCFFPQWASPAAAGDLVYVPRFDGALYAVRAGTGAVAWQLYLGAQSRVGPGLPGMLAGAKGCEWELPFGAPLYSPPAIAEDGMLLVGSGEGVLYAIVDDTRR
jgi:outer membrane protein assembly factor BamB